MANREAEIETELKNFSHIFERDALKIYRKKRIGNNLYWPYIAMDQVGGLPLKDGVGFISIQEKINNNQRISYTYKFSSLEYKILTSRNNVIECSPISPLIFHYDKEENDKPDKPHLSVVYPSIRYLTGDISLKDFLLSLEKYFFSIVQSSHLKKQDHIWCNKPV